MLRRAVVDVGSNSVLLLVAEQQGGQWAPLAETSVVTGLGVGTGESGLLGEEGLDRTLRALLAAKEVAARHGVTEVLSAATMAARIATNTPEFLARAHGQGTPVEVLSGEAEAELGFEAVANDPLFFEENRLSIVDPGGHSTELMTADRESHQPASKLHAIASWRVRMKESFVVGALGLRDSVLSAESPDLSARMAAMKCIDDAIGELPVKGDPGTVVALGATGTNLISIRDKLSEWSPDAVHGQVLEYEEISRAMAWMMDMSDAERARIPGIEPGRERTLPAGCLILERFLYALRAESCVVSARGWRHALLERGALP